MRVYEEYKDLSDETKDRKNWEFESMQKLPVYEQKPDSFHKERCMEAAQVLMEHKADLSKVTHGKILDPNNRNKFHCSDQDTMYNSYAGGVLDN